MKKIAVAVMLAAAITFPVCAAQVCWYEPGDPPIEHCCGEPEGTSPFTQVYFTYNPPLFVTASELAVFGRNMIDGCGNTSRVVDTVNIYCFGSGADCYTLNWWNGGWRPVGYVDGVTVVTITA